jgi:hypothetical protein
MNRDLLKALFPQFGKQVYLLVEAFVCIAIAPLFIYWLITGESFADISDRSHAVLGLALAVGGIVILLILDRFRRS